MRRRPQWHSPATHVSIGASPHRSVPMARPLAILLLLFTTLTVSAAPALKAKGTGLYHPTTVGARWVYQDTDKERTYLVTRVEEKDGAFLVDVAIMANGRETPSQRMRISTEGVFRLSVGGTTFPSPECLLNLPHKDGQEWEFDLGDANGGAAK